MKLRNILAGGMSAVTLLSLASCGGGIGNTPIAPGSSIKYDKLIKAHFENKKKDQKEDDIKYTYSYSWSSKWDKDWKKEFCEEHDITEDRLNKVIKENDTKLYTLTVKEEYNEDGEKTKVQTKYFVGLTESDLGDYVYVAGGFMDDDGNTSEYYNPSGTLASMFSGATPSNPFNNLKE